MYLMCRSMIVVLPRYFLFCKTNEKSLQLKKFYPKTIMNKDFLYKNHGREVIIFPQNFKTRCECYLSKSLKIIKFHRTSDRIIVFKSRVLHKMIIYDHGLSPLLKSLFKIHLGHENLIR